MAEHPARMAPISLRLTALQKERLKRAAERVGQNPHTLAQLALIAGVEAIEKFDGAVFPVQFDLLPRRVPVGRSQYPEHQPGASPMLNEGADDPPKPPGETEGKVAGPAKALKRVTRVSDKGTSRKAREGLRRALGGGGFPGGGPWP